MWKALQEADKFILVCKQGTLYKAKNFQEICVSLQSAKPQELTGILVQVKLNMKVRE
jgi:hypothetical protein